MLPLPTTDPVWVATPQDLAKMIRRVSSAPKLAVDTESNSLFAYREEVCLIQISVPGKDYLIDPLALDDISGLNDLFSNPRQQKIFHASEYDLICLIRDFHFTFSNIFDTLIAARILGEKQVGLGPLLAEKFGVSMDKKYQRANWGIRPLSKAMLDYARMDTHFLFDLSRLFEKELKEKGLWALASEDFDLACNISPPELNGHSCWKVSGAVKITPRQAAILQELCEYRDQQAQIINLPHFKVLSNDLLVELALATPHDEEELKTVKGITDRIRKRHANGLLNAIKTGEIAHPVVRQPRTRPDIQYMKRLEALRDWRKLRGRELKVESDVVLPRVIMEEIAAHSPGNLTELQEIMKKTPWRFSTYGGQILEKIGGN